MPHYAVVGLGFGDEGKGHVVDWLASNITNPLVVRFCGGPQAAHQVVLADGTRHIFSHFGSGTLREAPTYWSEFCPMNPIALMNELQDLQRKGYEPTLYIDAKSPVITPYEVEMNANCAEMKTGSCGVGIYRALKREEDHFHLWFEDLFHPGVVAAKMKLFKESDGGAVVTVPSAILDDFFWACREVANSPNVRLAYEMPRYVGGDARSDHAAYFRHTLIFEGAQGLMLDQNYGFFPHVTPSNTGMKNVLELLGEDEVVPRMCLVTRSYQTRHGNGPMSPIIDHNIKPNPVENNHDDGPQGEFRKTLLDLDTLAYAVAKEHCTQRTTPVLYLNHLDSVMSDHRTQRSGVVREHKNEEDFVRAVQNAVGAETVLRSYGPTAEDIKTEGE